MAGTQRQQPKILANGVAQRGARLYDIQVLSTLQVLVAQVNSDGQTVLEIRLSRRARAAGWGPPGLQGNDLETAGRLVTIARQVLEEA